MLTCVPGTVRSAMSLANAIASLRYSDRIFVEYVRNPKPAPSCSADRKAAGREAGIPDATSQVLVVCIWVCNPAVESPGEVL